MENRKVARVGRDKSDGKEIGKQTREDRWEREGRETEQRER